MKKIIYSSLLVLAITLLTSACDNDSDMNSPHGSTTPPEQVVLNGVKNPVSYTHLTLPTIA